MRPIQTLKIRADLENENKRWKHQRNKYELLTLLILLLFIGAEVRLSDLSHAHYTTAEINTNKETLILNNCQIKSVDGGKLSIWCDNISQYFGEPMSG